VGVAQTMPVLGDIEKNLQAHFRAIEAAQREGVKVLLFPELSLTGYNVGHICRDVSLWRTAPQIMALAKESANMYLVAGFLEEGAGAQFYNSSLTMKDGSLVYLHRKLNLATYGRLEEGKYFGTGRYIETFWIEPPWRGSILICADLWNPALPYLAALHGATLLMAPINSAEDAVSSEFSNFRGWDLAMRYYSMIYGLPILMANRVGREGDLTFWGGSQILDPFGNVLAQADEYSEQLIVADLDYQAVRKARHQLPTVRDSNLELVQREIKRIESYIGIPPLRETT
jgi:predicted amidohydrolase